MKHFTFLLVLLFLFYLTSISQNLIVNPGFETCSEPDNEDCSLDYEYCVPDVDGKICIVPPWHSYTGNQSLNNSYDYYPSDLFDRLYQLVF
jgi:hypothetical protein